MARTIVSLAVAGLAGVMGLAGGCSLPTDHSIKIATSPSVARSDRAMSVDCENRNGTVLVVVDPRITKPVVDVTVVDTGGGFMRRTPEATVKSWYAADMVLQDGRPVLRVLTSRDEKSQPPTYVNLTIRVPSCDGLRVRNTGGPVEVRGAWGNIKVENGYRGGTGGDVKVHTTRRLTDSVELSTTGGDISLRMPRESTGKLDLSSPNGDLEVAARTDHVSGVKRTATVYRAVLNNGSNPMTLTTGAGMVHVDIGDVYTYTNADN